MERQVSGTRKYQEGFVGCVCVYSVILNNRGPGGDVDNIGERR